MQTRNSNISNDDRIVSKFSSLIITCAPDIDQQGKEVIQLVRTFNFELFLVTKGNHLFVPFYKIMRLVSQQKQT